MRDMTIKANRWNVQKFLGQIKPSEIRCDDSQDEDFICRGRCYSVACHDTRIRGQKITYRSSAT